MFFKNKNFRRSFFKNKINVYICSKSTTLKYKKQVSLKLFYIIIKKEPIKLITDSE